MPDDFDLPPDDDFTTSHHHPDDDIIVETRIRRPHRVTARGPMPASLPVAIAPPAPLPAPTTPWPDPIPDLLYHGSITTLSGASGIGKTAWIASLIKLWQTGGDFYGHPTNRPTAIGFIAVDRPYRDHAEWFKRAACDPFPSYSLRDDLTVNWDHFLDPKQVILQFERALDQLNLPLGGLAIVDPLALFIAGNLNDYRSCGVGLAKLDHVIRRRQLSLFGTFHVGKEKGDLKQRYHRPQDRTLGSGAITGYSETAISLMSPAETGQPFYQLTLSPHLIPEERHALKRIPRGQPGEGLFVPCDPVDLLAEHATDVEKALSMFMPDTIHPAAWLLDRLVAGLACSQRHAEQLIADLVKTGRVVKIGRGKYQRSKLS